MKTNRNFIIIVIFAFIVTSVVTLEDKLYPDPQVYLGLAKNLEEGVGYIDNIRNDFILPSAGYPIILYIFNLLEISNNLHVSNVLIFLSALFFILFAFKVTKNLLLSSGLVLIFFYYLPSLSVLTIELPILFSTAVLCYSIILLFENRSLGSAIFAGICIFVVVLVRPIFTPVLFLSIIVTALFLLLSIKFKKIKVPSWLYTLLLAFFIPYLITLGISRLKYDDSRLVSGTYSGITLYSGLNNFIDLERPYYSTLWKRIPENEKKKGTEPYQLKDRSWQERDQVLKESVMEFVQSHPEKAFNAFLFRLKTYSFWNEFDLYKIVLAVYLVALALFLVLISVGRMDSSIIYLFFTLPIYIILVQSVFPFSGDRYYIYPLVFIFFTSIWMVYMLKSQLLNRTK